MEQDLTQYIEVVGEASYLERVDLWIADIELSVRAAKDETAVAEVGDLARAVVARLVDAGMAPDQIVSGGGEIWRPWHRKPEKAGRYATRRVTVRTPDEELLARALASLDGVASEERRSFTLRMRQPTFTSRPADVEAALVAAVNDARARATTLARAAGVRLGGVMRIAEMSRARRASGVHGDDDWLGDGARFGAYAMAGGGPAVAEGTAAIGVPERTIWVRYGVRFQLTPGGAETS